MKHIRYRAGNYVASITIYPGKPSSPNKSVNVSGGTYLTEQEALQAVDDIYRQLKNLDTFEQKRRAVDEYRNKHSTSAKRRCCGVAIKPNWTQCPVCGKIFGREDKVG